MWAHTGPVPGRRRGERRVEERVGERKKERTEGRGVIGRSEETEVGAGNGSGTEKVQCV